jgi:hypothetical protein
MLHVATLPAVRPPRTLATKLPLARPSLSLSLVVQEDRHACCTHPLACNNSPFYSFTRLACFPGEPTGALASSAGPSPFDGWEYIENHLAYNWTIPSVGGSSYVKHRCPLFVQLRLFVNALKRPLFVQLHLFVNA